MVAAVVLLSIIDLPAQVQTVMLHDKVAHLIAYAGLMGWFVQIFRHDLTRLVLLLGFVTLGIGVEFVQGMVPSRQFEVLDMIANTSGAPVYSACGLSSQPKAHKRWACPYERGLTLSGS